MDERARKPIEEDGGTRAENLRRRRLVVDTYLRSAVIGLVILPFILVFLGLTNGISEGELIGSQVTNYFVVTGFCWLCAWGLWRLRKRLLARLTDEGSRS